MLKWQLHHVIKQGELNVSINPITQLIPCTFCKLITYLIYKLYLYKCLISKYIIVLYTHWFLFMSFKFKESSLFDIKGYVGCMMIQQSTTDSLCTHLALTAIKHNMRTKVDRGIPAGIIPKALVSPLKKQKSPFLAPWDHLFWNWYGYIPLNYIQPLFCSKDQCDRIDQLEQMLLHRKHCGDRPIT